MMKKELLAEAKFYQVQGIVALLEGNSLIASIILKSESHRSAVTSWLPSGATCSLLYRASTDGKTPAGFHRCCDNEVPTLIVVQSKKYICGGYTSKSWTSRMKSIFYFTNLRYILNYLRNGRTQM